eukprot:TRINITY_DN12626_c0_g1_i2.p1 TRINITY_DN12626_c0_g1~~TRINITY_DN12626_c0_g1_i2.p1  ORF type:complete len:580 (+),score=80.35 TRINITY_DN12626_c0_g1_i2:49-1740(+)
MAALAALQNKLVRRQHNNSALESVDNLKDKIENEGPAKSALNKFKLGGALAIAKRKMDKQEADLARVRKAAGVDPIQAATVMCFLFLLFWITASGVLSTMFTLRYIGLVTEEQSWYMLNGAADFARAEAFHALSAAGRVPQALHTALQSGHIATRYDYAAMERTLAALLLHTPSVRSVDLSFSDSSCGLRLSHRRTSDVGESMLLLQSNALDCFLLGPEGCIDLGVDPGVSPRYTEVIGSMGMPEQESVEGGTRWTREQIVAWSRQAPRKEEWNQNPKFVQGKTDDGGVVWIPSIQLEFRLPLPVKWANDGRHILVGFATFETASLSGSRLLDPTLGPKGRSFLVDRNGMVLSAQSSSETIQVETGTQRLKFRHLRDLPDSGWASMLNDAFLNGKINALQVSSSDGLAAVVAPLDEPLQDFAVVVVGNMEGSNFKDSTVFTVMITLTVFASLPFLIALFAFFGGCAASGEEQDASAGKSVANRATNALQRMTTLVHGASATIGRRTSIIGRQSGADEDAAARHAGHGRATFVMNDLAFEQDKSFKGSCARCLRRWCGKGRQEE